MNTKADKFDTISEDCSLEDDHSSSTSDTDRGDSQESVRTQSDEHWVNVNPQSCPRITPHPVAHRMIHKGKQASFRPTEERNKIDAIQAVAAEKVNAAETERDFAKRRCKELESAAAKESKRFAEAIRIAAFEKDAAKVNYDASMEATECQYEQEITTLTEAALRDNEIIDKLKAEKKDVLAQLAEVKSHLDEMVSEHKNPPPCQICSLLEMENERIRRRELDQRLRFEQDAQGAQEWITGAQHRLAGAYKEIAEQKAEITRLNATADAPHESSQSSSENPVEEDLPNSIETTNIVKHVGAGHPLIMRIAAWVGGDDGADVELALVKMNPDTPFKSVLEHLRFHHPLKALKQECTGRYIFDSDTPAYLGVKDGEEFDFIQQNDEPMFMFDATMDGAECWRGKDSRI